MNKKKVILIASISVIALILWGIFSLSKVIVDNSYNSRGKLSEKVSEKSEEKEDLKYTVVQSPTEVGDEGADYSDEGLDDSDNYELYSNKNAYGKLKELLSEKESPFDFKSYSVIESKNQDGETELSVFNGSDCILIVYCDKVSNTPYCFISGTNGFTDRELGYIGSLGNGTYSKTDDNRDILTFY